jgi:hypothetical protein
MSIPSTCATTAGTMSQQEAFDLLLLCESEPVLIEADDSHFFDKREQATNQSFPNGAYIWKPKKDGRVSALTAKTDLTMLQTRDTVLFQFTQVPFHPLRHQGMVSHAAKRP